MTEVVTPAETRVVTLGELLLRLRAPGHERLLQTPRLEATFGGGEANVAVSLASLGLDAAFVTALPDNALGDAAIGELRRFGVDCSHCVRAGRRLGLYFLEQGSNQRPAKVLYDRAGSAIAETESAAFDWRKIFAGAGWLHITGITPALSASAADLALEACWQAKQHGLTVSCDLSYRALLWQYGRAAPEVMPEIFRLVDVGIGGREDCQRALGIGELGEPDEPGGSSPSVSFEALTQKVMEAFPNLTSIALTIRDSKTADRNGWTACLRDADGFIEGPAYQVDDIVDRVGAGDAFAAGLIYGLNRCSSAFEALAFATAAGCLKHTISGDFNRVSTAEVETLMAGEASGRVQR